MRLRSSLFILATALLAIAGCASGGAARGGADGPRPADPDALPQTQALFANLLQISPDHVLFGHHDDLAYGTTWRGEPGRSDVKETAGSYPAVYGWDVSRLFRRNRLDQPDPERQAELRTWILDGHARGGVVELCWHMENPVARTNSWDTTRAVYAILPGGERHDLYRGALDELAAFLKTLTPEGSDEPVPVIFRPFHEHTGDWFWWGRAHSTVEEFTGLWRFTAEYLRDEKEVHNLLYAYSTDVFDSREEYLERYPGDNIIDILGFDDYHSVKTVASRDTFAMRLRTVGELATERGKLAALTETGVETVPDSMWWTNVLLPAIKTDAMTRRIAYALVWRNANPDGDRADHFYAPFPGHPSAPDFVRFYQDDFVLFEDELPDLYTLPGSTP
ncbi:glycoside hydrolase family 26 protein [Rubricoccus marinus]|uniref:glycoside hydrolase family 26 protein n=1 Tax=Rubricoccus marinus TaxID=716817 RepID=UPI000B9917B4|nr:glycosyl hydrolase [Rubricoccus marinus]